MEKKEDIRQYTLEELQQMEDQSNWEALENMTEEELEARIASDPDADFETDWSTTMTHFPWEKEKISLRVDGDILEWFRKQGKGYQTRMNAVLRAYMDAHK